MVTYNNGKTPGATQYVQAVQQVTNGEATVNLYGGGWTGTGDLVLDKDNATFVSNHGHAVINIVLKFPMLISRVAINAAVVAGGMTLNSLAIGLVGGGTKNLVTVVGGVEVGSNGFDSGNFAPVLAKTLSLNFASDLPGEEIDIYEVSIFKVIEVKPTAESRAPLMTLSEGQLVLDDVDYYASTYTAGVVPVTGPGDPGDVVAGLLNKQYNSGGVNIGATSNPENITFLLTHPILINRVALYANGCDDVSVDVVDNKGVTTRVIAESDSATGLDSGNFEPILATQIIINQAATSGGSSIGEVVVEKVLPAGVTIDNLPLLTELYTADGTSAQVVNLDKRGRKMVQALGVSSSATKLHIFTISFSFDNVHWYVHYISAAAEQFISKTIESAARYWEIDSDAVVGAHTIDLILGAVD